MTGFYVYKNKGDIILSKTRKRKKNKGYIMWLVLEKEGIVVKHINCIKDIVEGVVISLRTLGRM